MANLTDDQMEFLDDKFIPMERVLDATGMKPSEYGPLAKRLNKWIVYGITPCKRFGHTLRTRKGICVQCHPASLGMLIRYEQSGIVYIAVSRQGKFLKIGSTQQNIDLRISQLNKFKYGEVDDWVCYMSHLSEEAYKIEWKCQDVLKDYRLPGVYYWNGGVQRECHELFSIKPSTAKAILLSIFS